MRLSHRRPCKELSQEKGEDAHRRTHKALPQEENRNSHRQPALKVYKGGELRFSGERKRAKLRQG